MNLVGDATHNLIDGLVIGASYLLSIPLGLATTLAVILHEIPQEISDYGVLLHGGFTRGRAIQYNFFVALSAIAGAIIALLLGGIIEHLTLYLLPLAAGGFIYIAGSDLIPELHKSVASKTAVQQLFGLVLGILCMLLIVE